MTVQELEKTALEIRINLLKLCHKELLHIGGDLSITDVMTVLWLDQMKYNPKNIKDENRDRFVLSKGHASAVTSFCQAAIGCFSSEEVLNEYGKDSGMFSMHSCNLANPYVEVSTGSLGHGMPVACGIAAGLRLKGNMTSRVYTVMGDGEQAEGSIWEAAMNAAHYHLGNVVAIVDNNKLGFDGTIDEITGIGDLAEKYRVFGWNVVEIDGNSIPEIKKAFAELPPADSDKPTCIIAHTVKGKGVSYMENQLKWHGAVLTDEEYELAIKDLTSTYQRRWSK